MTHPRMIRERRAQSLASFVNTIANIDGVTEEHLVAMRDSGKTVSGGATRITPKIDDAFGNVAFNAASLDALVQALARQQERIATLEARLPNGAAAKKLKESPSE